MIHRNGYLAIGLCYGGAAIFAILAILSVVRAVELAPIPVLLLGGILFVVAGFQLQTLLSENSQQSEERKSKIELLQAQVQEQKNAVDDMADGLDIAIFVCDLKANIQYANRRAIELFRFERPIGRNILAVTLSYDLEQQVITTAKSGTPQNAEITFTYPDERVGLAKTWPTNDGGERVFLSVYEITDLRRLERVRQDFVANVSHELRTPLTIIRSMAETMLDDEGEISERSSRYLTKIVGEVDRLTLISQDLLILSASESNPVRKHRCDIGEVFRNVVQQLEPKATKKSLSLTFEGPLPCVIEANSSQMTQVALNLIDNAIIYTATGTVTVKVVRGDAEVTISVTDTGIGVPSDQIDRIFERFYRVDRARSRATGGTGLGLSIVKHIVEAHGGTVNVASSLNNGSTFTVTMPIGD